MLKINGEQEFLGKVIKVVEGGFGEDKRVVFDSQVAQIHEVENSTIRKSINRLIERGRLKEGIDFIDIVKGGKEFTTFDLEQFYHKSSIAQAKNIFVLSERGYVKVVKAMDDDKSWDIMDEFIDKYFTMREIIQSEEEMLKKLYPSVPEDFIKLSAHNIREVATLKLENKKKEEVIIKTKAEVKHKVKVIDDLTKDMDTPLICKTITDYINILAYKMDEPHAKIYSNIYSVLGRRLNKDIKYGREKYISAQRQLVIDNIAENKKSNLKGEDRKFPFKMKDSKASISILEYIVDVLGEGHLLIETIAKLAEVGVDDVIEKYNYYKSTNIDELM